jgi:hypothetical protein
MISMTRKTYVGIGWRDELRFWLARWRGWRALRRARRG